MALDPVADHFNQVADMYEEVIPFFSTFAARFDQRIPWPDPRQPCWTWVQVGEP